MTVSVPYSFTNGTGADAEEVNSNFDAVTSAFDDYLPLTGGTVSGPIVLPNTDPTLNNHAARKKYVDDEIAALVLTPADGSITAAKLAADAVTTVKIVDDAVTAAKLADASVDLGTAVTTGSLQLSKLENVAYTSFTATLKQNVTVTSTTNWGAWRREGRRIVGYCKVTASSSGTSGNAVNVLAASLPAPLRAGAVCGSGFYKNNGYQYVMAVRVNTTSGAASFDFIGNTTTDPDTVGVSPSLTVSSGEFYSFEFDYEAAS